MLISTLTPAALTLIHNTIRDANAILLNPLEPCDFFILASEHQLPDSWLDRLTYLHSLPPSESQGMRGRIYYQQLQPADSSGRPYYIYPSLGDADRAAVQFIILVKSHDLGFLDLIPMPYFLDLYAQAPQGRAYV